MKLNKCDTHYWFGILVSSILYTLLLQFTTSDISLHIMISMILFSSVWFIVSCVKG